MNKVKVELHTHTNYSYDCNLSFEKIVEICKEKEIDVLGVADHNQIEGALRLSMIAPFKVIVGEEIFTKEGEIIGFYLKKFIKPGLSAENTIKEIRKQGGIVYIPHPFDKTTRKTAINLTKLQDLLQDVDIIEIHNGRSVFDSDNEKAKNFAKENKKLTSIGSDSHTFLEFGRNFLSMDNFTDSKSFLKNLKSAKHFKNRPLFFPFVLTKLVRFKKKYFKSKKILHYQLTGALCDLCGSKKYKIIYKAYGTSPKKYLISDDSYGVSSQIVKCSDCGLIYCFPRINPSKNVKRYSLFKDNVYEKERKPRKINQNEILVNIEQYIKKGNILDIGAATGVLLEAARDRGWRYEGIEPSKWAVNFAKEKYGIQIHSGTLKTVNFKKKVFNAITLIDVLEHVDSPREVLSKVKELLSDSGVAVIVTPNIASLFSKLMKRKWWHIRPDHIYYFNFKTLSMLVKSLGFEIIKVKTANWNFSYNYWSSRFKRKLPFLYNILLKMEQIPLFKFITKRYYSINFQDSMELYIKKRDEF